MEENTQLIKEVSIDQINAELYALSEQVNKLSAAVDALYEQMDSIKQILKGNI